MNTSVISGDDIRFLVQQSPEQLTTIIGQMTSLMEGISNLQDDTNNRVEIMENQKWYQRMFFTIIGKNKASKNEIKKNQDRIVSYISEAVASLFQMNCIEMQSICSLGNRINQVYADVTHIYNEQLQIKAQISEMQIIQQQTIQSLGKFVSILNQKIESIDNYHMLLTEIQQKKYCNNNKIAELCRVLSQLDKRVVEDERKLSILKEAVVQSEMIDDTAVPIKQFLNDVLSIPEDRIGIVYLELCNYRDNFPSNIFVELIEKYHFLSKMEKMSKQKDVLIQTILDQSMIDGDIEFTYSDIYDSFIEHKKMSFVNEIKPAIEANPSSTVDMVPLDQEPQTIMPAKYYSDVEVNSLADTIETKKSNKEVKKFKEWLSAAVKNANSIPLLDDLEDSEKTQSESVAKSYSQKSASSILDDTIYIIPKDNLSKAYDSKEVKSIPDKIARAKKKFGFRSTGEVIGLIDTSLFNNGNSGYLFTDDGIAFDYIFTKVFVRYDEIDKIEFGNNNKKIIIKGDFASTNGNIPEIDNMDLNLNWLKDVLEELSRFKKYGY